MVAASVFAVGVPRSVIRFPPILTGSPTERVPAVPARWPMPSALSFLSKSSRAKAAGSGEDPLVTVVKLSDAQRLT